MHCKKKYINIHIIFQNLFQICIFFLTFWTKLKWMIIDMRPDLINVTNATLDVFVQSVGKFLHENSEPEKISST